MTLERGAVLNNRYRILEILGEGGMGAVYKAIDENLGVTVAVKENLFTTDEYTRQFQIEASILATLRHPNLPRVTDHFVIEGEGQYLVMDFIEGEDLRDRLDRLGTLTDREVIAIGVAMCDALSYLHTRTPPVLHRDMKPGNVKISPNGQVHLVDFGLAKIVQGSQITITGARAMTPGYSPPEQYGTARTDARSDIYSLGATLYSALTGSLPEDGLARAMNQVELVPVRKRNPRVNRKLAAAIEKSLAVLPDERFQTAEEFKKALIKAGGLTTADRDTSALIVSPPPAAKEETSIDQGIISPNEPGQDHKVEGVGYPVNNGLAISTPLPDESFDAPARKPIKSTGWLGLGLLLFLLLLGGGTAGAYFFPGETQRLLAQVGIPGYSLSATLPPATNTVEAFIPSPTQQGIIPPPTNTPTPTNIPDTPTPTPTFTRTSRPTNTLTPTKTPTLRPTPLGGAPSQLAFVSNATGKNQIYLVFTDGTGLVQVTNEGNGACQPDWSPDGTRLVYISPCRREEEEYNNTGLFLINADGTGRVGLPAAAQGDFDPDWSPDGKSILFTSFRNGKPQVFVMNLEDYSTTLLAGEGAKNLQPAWSSDGSRIAFVSNRQGPLQIWLMNADGTDQVRFSRTNTDRILGPRWSPDDKNIAFYFRENETGIPKLALYTVAVGGQSIIRLVDDLVPRRSPSYSPDGLWIAYEAWPQGENHDIFIMEANGGKVIQITNTSFYEFDPIWRPVTP